MPVVLNKKNKPSYKGAVYVGRPSKWGNPYVMGVNGTRESVILRYITWLVEKINAGELDLSELRGKNLICWCAPEACHADILLLLANQGG